MINVIETSTSERNKELECKYSEYMCLFYTTTLSIADIRKSVGVSPRSEAHKFIRNRLRCDSVNAYARAALIRKGEWLNE